MRPCRLSSGLYGDCARSDVISVPDGEGEGSTKKAKPATEQLDLDNSEPQTPPAPRQALSLATGSIGISVFERRVKSERYSNQSLTFLE